MFRVHSDFVLYKSDWWVIWQSEPANLLAWVEIYDNVIVTFRVAVMASLDGG